MTLTREEAAGRIMVALDRPDEAAAESLIRALEGIPCWLKVGMELFYAAGPAFVAGLKDRGYRVFLDVKMHDIPNTVKGGAASVTRLGVDLFNVHAAGGVRMMEAALEGAEAASGGRPRPRVIAVTQLTSTSQAVLNDEIGIPGTAEEAVVRYARLARRAGLDGVVASAREVRAVKAACGGGFLAVTPGIRPASASADDQERIMTPREALDAGADFLVIGRPITAAPDPREAFESIVRELTHG
ncbi:MAG: orotidine-5'-phosphate decarboxylase [Thermobacillus sp.]|uniref:Orotidine 5'-phosphate decarboxylase n=1 Tax=Thermobacillus composti (strain DSM 18247 / JCM 13945 / KWC4) TaxID=717605 RepID=L0EFK1_THECK|nr:MULTISPECIES: orotidine-5'-phosphate decarboxylase [Thermobacillus]AGA58399.1 orotidine 5''-phosphate decarboxylase, subfamily 1 [Thermobacillus composti KWC4]REK54783.1 MAG: orotidine-5'-phosphate decarboxylase [Thermobacillus sp.]